MKARKATNRRWGLVRIVLAIALPLGALTAAFTYLPHSWIGKAEQLGFAHEELTWYGHLFDRRAEPPANVVPEVFAFAPLSSVWVCPADGLPADAQRMAFTAEGCNDTVDVAPLPGIHGAFTVRSVGAEACRGQRSLVLQPASVASMRSKYIELIATDLGLLCPEVSFVQVSLCWKDQGVFMKEEQVDQSLLRKRRIKDGALFTQGASSMRPDQLFPQFGADSAAARVVRQQEWTTEGASLLDPKSAAAVLFLQMAEERTDLLDDACTFMYRWSTGTVSPTYHAPRSAPVHQALQPVLLGEALRAPGMPGEWERIRSALLAKEQVWRERFTAMDKAWLPIVRQGVSAAAAQQQADALKDLLFDRIRTGAPLAELGPVLAQAQLPPVFLEAGARSALPKEAEFLQVDRLIRELKVDREGDTLIFRRGVHSIMRDALLPPGIAVRMEEGARIFLAPGASLLVNGQLDIRGTRLRPVFIRAAEKGKPFGSIAVNGTGNFTCHIKGLQISGGAGATIQGVRHEAMLSVHHADVELQQCILNGFAGPVAFAQEHGKLALTDCQFESAVGSLVQLEQVNGRVEGSSFRNGADDATGSGLVLSGSELLVRDCRFEKFATSAITAGETSQLLVIASRFDGNGTALDLLDMSVAHASRSSFISNTTVFHLARKDPALGGAVLFVHDNEFVGNTTERTLDRHSRITPLDAPDAKVWAQFGVAL